jgi:transcriptional regulator with XRE-family HTH domain
MNSEQPNSNAKEPFGAAVREWRTRLCIPQEELGRRANLHPSYISDIERGTRNPSLESVIRIAHSLEISAGTLFSYDAPPKQYWSGEAVFRNKRSKGTAAVNPPRKV